MFFFCCCFCLGPVLLPVIQAKTEMGPNHILVEQICLSSSLSAHWSCMSVEGCRTPDGGAQVNDDTWYLYSLGTHKGTLPLTASASRACGSSVASQAGLLSHSAIITITSPSLQTSHICSPTLPSLTADVLPSHFWVPLLLHYLSSLIRIE